MPRALKGTDMKSRIKNLMTNPDNWITLTVKGQHEFLGFYHDTRQLLFIEDHTLLPSCPVKPSADYIYQDINLSIGSAFKTFTFETQINGKKWMFRANEAHVWVSRYI